jgi:hypothetical protein
MIRVRESLQSPRLAAAFSEQFARPDVASQNTTRFEPGGFSDGAFGRSVQRRLCCHARADTVTSDVGGIHTCPRRSGFENRRDRVAMQASTHDVAARPNALDAQTLEIKLEELLKGF